MPALLSEPLVKPKNTEPIPSPGDLPDLVIKLGSPALQVDSLPAELPGKPQRMCVYCVYVCVCVYIYIYIYIYIVMYNLITLLYNRN